MVNERPKLKQQLDSGLTIAALKHHLPQGYLGKITSEHDIPDIVWRKIRDFELSRTFDSMFRYVDENNIETYILARTHYSVREQNAIATQLAYTVDVQDGAIVGYGGLLRHPRNSEDPFPCESGNRTIKQYRKQGLGTRRLQLLNACSRAWFGDSLYSRWKLTKKGRRLWEKLRIDGKAEIVPTLSGERYRYVDATTKHIRSLTAKMRF